VGVTEIKKQQQNQRGELKGKKKDTILAPPYWEGAIRVSPSLSGSIACCISVARAGDSSLDSLKVHEIEFNPSSM